MVTATTVTPVPPATTRATAERLRSLDGVRGAAALVVVFYHLSLFARPVLSDGRWEPMWTTLTQSPLKLAFAGTEAVLVFFALSGLVVALPMLRAGRDFSIVGFLASRAVRLYLPVWAALALSAAFVAFLPRPSSAVTPGSWMERANVQDLDPIQLLSEASLMPASYDVVNVLWSLRWEVLFSVLLPVFVLVTIALRRQALLVGVLAAAATVTGRILGLDALVYLPVFLLGTLVAARLDEVRAWSARRGPLTWLGLAVGSGLLLIASWLGRPLSAGDPVLSSVLWGLAGVGAIGVVVLAIGSPLARRVLETRWSQWLGRVSFSLYLVHVPVIATLGYLLGERRWWLVILLALPGSLLVSALFHRAVELPTHRLARGVGRRVARLRWRRTAPA